MNGKLPSMLACFLPYRDSHGENVGKKIGQKILPKDSKRMRLVQIFGILVVRELPLCQRYRSFRSLVMAMWPVRNIFIFICIYSTFYLKQMIANCKQYVSGDRDRKSNYSNSQTFSKLTYRFTILQIYEFRARYYKSFTFLIY
jgi:hypothetical protein